MLAWFGLVNSSNWSHYFRRAQSSLVQRHQYQVPKKKEFNIFWSGVEQCKHNCNPSATDMRKRAVTASLTVTWKVVLVGSTPG